MPETTKIDEFAPHWSALYSEGTLTVTFEIDTDLADIPDVPLIDLLRRAVSQQRGEMVSLCIIVNGQEYRTLHSTAATVRTVVADAIAETFNVGRDVEDWELRDADGRLIDHALTLGAALSNFPNSDPLWLSLRAGYCA